MMLNQSERTNKLRTNQDRKRGLLYQNAGNAYVQLVTTVYWFTDS